MVDVTPRGRLLALIGERTHVAVCAPSGYGKTTLLEAVQASTTRETRFFSPDEHSADILLQLMAEQPARLIVDDGHLLREDLIVNLLALDPRTTQVIIALRHLFYPSVPALRVGRKLSVIDSTALAFTADEIVRLGASPSTAEELLRSTLGWPSLTLLAMNPYFELGEYLESFVTTLPDDLLPLVGDLAQLEQWGTASLIKRERVKLAQLLNTGFPLIHQEMDLIIHPVMKALVQEYTESSYEIESSQLRLLQELMDDRSPPFQKLARVEHFFKHGGDDDQNISQKVTLLSEFDRADLSPSLRDTFAYYLISSGNTKEAESLLIYQQSLRTTSTRTFTFLARIAARNNDLVRYKEYLKLAFEAVQDDSDRVRAYISEEYYYMYTDDLARALRSATNAYEAGARSGNVELYIYSLHALAHVQQLSSLPQAALKSLNEGLRVTEGQGQKFPRMMVLLHAASAELCKDQALYEEALAHIQAGLNMQLVTSIPNVPFLYAIRGLIYLEMGLYEDALDALKYSSELYLKASDHHGNLYPQSFLIYVYYLLGQHEQISSLFEQVRQLKESSTDVSIREDQVFYPLVEGIWYLSMQDERNAVKAFRAISLSERTLTFDSTLLNSILLSGLLIEHRQFTDEDYARLKTILDARNSDRSVAAYAKFSPALFGHLAELGYEPERARAITVWAQSMTGPRAKPLNRITLHTMGRVSLEINGNVCSPTSRSLDAFYVFAYLIHKQDWVSSDELGMALFPSVKEPRRRAQQAMSDLRKLLSISDHEVAQLLSKHNPSFGYRIEQRPGFELEVDFARFLQLDPATAPRQDLEAFVEQYQPSMPLCNGSFAEEINRQLGDQLTAVIEQLALRHLEEGKEDTAIKWLSRGYALTQEPELLEWEQRLRTSRNTSALQS